MCDIRKQSVRSMRGGLFLIVAAICGAAAAQESKPPAGEEVLKRCIEATGGKTAHEKLKNRVSTGTLEFPAMGITGKITVVESAPNLAHTIVDMEGLGKSEQGSDGETLWEMSDAQGPRILEGEEREIMKRQTTFHWFMKWQELYAKVENAGEETVGEAKCWKIQMTPKVGAPESWFIDQKDFLLRRMDFTLKNPMGEIPVKVTFSDHKVIDGVSVAMTALQEVVQMRMTTKLSEVKHNVDLPKDEFKLPEAIQELKSRPTSKPSTKPEQKNSEPAAGGSPKK
ncbi:MAG: hypothetical protein JNG88_00730 [Phycisphaerales bacterium]|nr:hypothetical protein [Phycisphaerales bacterium]